ncbi:biotin-dependent carboxyltransferase family protein [Luteimonas sp. SDU82]|uniref:5-oxoprolinase subunit C family protein n=1 Tax=Luteimonas sp. SDU82 TaxID=3422592 RepID=UPI003EBA0157
MASRAFLEVEAAGLLTTVQGAARTGLRHLGVASGGAADPWAHALANLLVGNPAGSAALEITLAGPTLRFHGAARIALCGAAIEAQIDGVAIPGNRPVDLPAGSRVRLGGCRDGARSYLAVAGGLDLPEVLGSVATDLRGGFGGFDGRVLRAGDSLPVGGHADLQTSHVQAAAWWIDASPLPHTPPPGEPRTIRLLPGADAAPLPSAATWRVDARSNRQGLRLQGPALQVADARERVSEPVAPGTVQLPPDGQPIVLLADAQTHGGYPRIGHVPRADLPLLAQLRPGARLRFLPCTPAEACRANAEQRQRMHRIALAIAARSPRA